MRVADYIFKTLADQGVKNIFMVTGGGAMFLNDAIGREHRIEYVSNHHEQASAIAAEGYARIKNRLGVACVTTGPGGINALNGVYGSWTDSIPLLIVSGQVKRETCLGNYDLPDLRQLGDQEIDIISVVQSITKYSAQVLDPNQIRYHLEKALFLATSGRPGPCWLDIPVDVQSTEIDEDNLPGYQPDQTLNHIDTVNEQCPKIIELIRSAKRPVIMAGTGIRTAGALDIFEEVIRKLNLPVTTAWTHDLIDTDHPLFSGRPGTIGDRAGNFTVQNADLLLVLGSRLNIRQIGYNWKSFARHAYKIHVDIDAAELSKPTLTTDLKVHCDVKQFLEKIEALLPSEESTIHTEWLDWCKSRVKKYPIVLERHLKSENKVNPYRFIDNLFESLNAEDIVVCGNGTATVVTFQAAKIKKGQRVFSNSGAASMGWDLPAAIGAAFANNKKRVICLAGDGSLQMNIQELQTIVHHQLPIKLFVLNNQGYLSIKMTQTSFFKGHMVGSGPESGVSFPDIVKVAAAYGIKSKRIEGGDLTAQIESALNEEGPIVCDVILDPDQVFEPKSSSKTLEDGRIVSAPLEDMAPFLDRDELLTNLLIPPYEEES
jgi:acetolactate synthase I/II/III large subunit